MKSFLIVIFTALVLFSAAVENEPLSKINPELLSKYWSAAWIAYPEDSGLEYGVYHFRKTFHLDDLPEEFIIHVSADNRYRLFVNGEPVCFGPARGDLMHWRFESVDVRPFLQTGKNVIAAVVWNFANIKPWSQMSYRTAFILQGNSVTEKITETGSGWKVIRNEAYSPANADSKTTGGEFVVVGPCDEVHADKYPWEWQRMDFDDSGWLNVKVLEKGRPKEAGTGISWGLQPREIPLMEAKIQQFEKVRRAENLMVDESFVTGNKSLEIPANSTVTFLLDQGVLTTAYPEMTVSAGKGSKIQIKYAEALFDENRQKGNRNETEGKRMRGYADIFFPDGGENRLFRPLWLRTWRYVEVIVETKDNPLIIKKFESEFTGYPFEENGSFKSDDEQLTKIWNVGWRTARLCAGETYYDCPYYEQLQYVGDTRIQALISLYVSGDDRLMRKAIQVFDDSRFSEGLTMSRYPSSTPQVIPPYSLFWVDMVYDYWMHRDDSLFVSSFLNGIDNVLHFFISRIDSESGLLGKTGYWNFVDWAIEWPWNNAEQSGGVPKGGYNGQSSILSFHLAYSAKHAAEIFRWAGNENQADYYERIADDLVRSVINKCWDNEKKYVADTPEKDEFSMHAQIFASLTGGVPEDELGAFVSRFKDDKSLIQPTMYFRFYLTQAMKKAGLADQYLETLDLWREMLDLGLTTFAEKPDPSRSDCHAWSASPNYDFLATVAGVEPDSPGFKTIKMEPHLGNLNEITGKLVHPNGIISFDLKKQNEKGITGIIELPEGITGNFKWNRQKIVLNPGKNPIEL